MSRQDNRQRGYQPAAQSGPQSGPITPQGLLFSAATITGASLLHWPELPLWIPALLIAAIAWRLLIVWRGWRRPTLLTRLILAFAAFSAVLVQFNTVTGLQAGSALLVVMVALKFLETRSRRDQMVLMIICYFLVFASVLQDRSFWALLWLVIFLFVTTAGLLQLGREGSWLPARVTARMAGRLLLQAVPVMIVLFVLFPRLPGPLWGMPAQSAGATTGLSDTMSPGDIAELGLSREIVFRVEFTGSTPSPAQMYWRGPVMTAFNGRSWSVGPVDPDPNAPDVTFLGEPVHYRVQLEPQRGNRVFALELPASWSPSAAIRMDSFFQLHAVPSPRRRSGGLDYEVTSHLEHRAGQTLTAAQRQRWTSVPEQANPRARALAASWLEQDATPRTLIERALTMFGEQEFHYTLTPPLLGAQPVDEFLFETRAGFCEHYASAFAVLMRTAGIPARVVTGYHGGERNPLGGYFMIRQSDAHAWTEVWLDGEGWVRVDPTAAVAPERIDMGAAASALAAADSGRFAAGGLRLMHQLSLLRDAADRYWYQWVMGFGPQLQQSLLQRLGLNRTGVADLLLATALATAACMVVLSLVLSLRGARRRVRDPAAIEFQRFCRRLAALPIAPRHPAEGPSAFVARASAVCPASQDAMQAVLAAYLRARYEAAADERQSALSELQRRVAGFRPDLNAARRAHG
jgi:protein-glutamine gamma-glutamyltransferase